MIQGCKYRAHFLVARCFAASGLMTIACVSASAQDFAWSENAGWLNWAEDNGDDQGPAYSPDAISGFVWGENIGWINLGDGAPVPPASSQTGEDFGVGIDHNGFLFGYAWGENIGWVNFGPYMSTPDQPRFHRGRLLGYAWAENIGWINLDDDEHFVQLACPADLNGDGINDIFDVFVFLDQFNAGSLRADWDLSGTLDIFDVFGFLSDFGMGCP